MPEPETRLTRMATLREPQTVAVTARVRAEAVVVTAASCRPEGERTESANRERAGAWTVRRRVPSSGVATVAVRLRVFAPSAPLSRIAVGPVQGVVTSCCSAASAVESG